MFLVILKASLALLLNGNVMNISRFLTILWLIPWGNWVPNVLIQWSSLFSLSDLFLCALPWSGICSMGYKIILYSAPKQILSALLKCLDTGPFLFLRISDMWLNILSFKQRPVSPTYLSPQALHSMIYMIFFDKQFNPPNIRKSKSSLLKCDFSSKYRQHWHLLDLHLMQPQWDQECFPDADNFSRISLWPV